jgi:hypothetical protein
MAYVVIDNKSNSHMNIILNKSINNNERVFTNTSILYRVLSNNFDVVENITEKVVRMQSKDVIKSIEAAGREQNKALKKVAFEVFDTLGWDQHPFNIGFDYIKGTYYEKITEDVKSQYTDIIEEAFFTMSNRNNFYQFLRNYTEGSIKSKEHMVELLKDLLYGIKFNEMMNKHYNDTYGVNEE